MKTLKVLLAMLFISALTNAVYADPEKDYGGTNGTDANPDCDYVSVSEYL